LKIYSTGKTHCGGLLKKRATRTKFLFKGTLQERYFFVNLAPTDSANYALEYCNSEADMTSRHAYALDGMSVRPVEGTGMEVTCRDGTVMALEAATAGVRDRWVQSLREKK
jgi:hypothetical protein